MFAKRYESFYDDSYPCFSWTMMLTTYNSLLSLSETLSNANQTNHSKQVLICCFSIEFEKNGSKISKVCLIQPA